MNSESASSFWGPAETRYLPTSCRAWWCLATPPLPRKWARRSEYYRWLRAAVEALWSGPSERRDLLWPYAPYRQCLEAALELEGQSRAVSTVRLHRGCQLLMVRLKLLQCFLQRQNCLIHHSRYGSCTEHASSSRGGVGGERPPDGCGDGDGCYLISLCQPVFQPEDRLALHSSCCCPPGIGEPEPPGVYSRTLVELARLL